MVDCKPLQWNSILPDSPETCSGSIFGEQTEEKEDEVLMVIVGLIVVEIEGSTRIVSLKPLFA